MTSNILVYNGIIIPKFANISLLKYFRTAWLVQKLNVQKYIRNIDDNAVQGRLSENYLNYYMKYFRHEIFAIYDIIAIHILWMTIKE